MALQESGEMYLEHILTLREEKGVVRAIDVANLSGYSKPSVSRAIGLLKKGGYVVTDENGYLLLTEAGRESAAKTYERHTILTELFIRLGVDPHTASEDACKVEHDLSDATFRAIKTYVESLK
mgnify:CR=1 FL=1